ncbi:hypothetical protein Avbf_02773 [Armadillidium vulgare]|nr:hypothetical protein Avbf_02773 [Armadillidium vulgare]
MEEDNERVPLLSQPMNMRISIVGSSCVGKSSLYLRLPLKSLETYPAGEYHKSGRRCSEIRSLGQRRTAQIS